LEHRPGHSKKEPKHNQDAKTPCKHRHPRTFLVGVLETHGNRDEAQKYQIGRQQPGENQENPKEWVFHRLLSDGLVKSPENAFSSFRPFDFAQDKLQPESSVSEGLRYAWSPFSNGMTAFYGAVTFSGL
jgi:hypothetical protein